jgi:hypothetical protein
MKTAHLTDEQAARTLEHAARLRTNAALAPARDESEGAA